MKMNLVVPFDKKPFVPINLQMFAGTADQESKIISEDDEVIVEEDDDLPDEEDDDEEETEESLDDEEQDSEDDETEEEESDESKEDDDEDQEDAKLKKAESAAIRYKQENKNLRKELERLRQEKQNQLDKSLIESRTAALIEEGHSEEQAKKIAKTEVENNAIERKIEINRVMELKGEYPGIEDHAIELVEMKSKYPDFSYKELYKAKFAEESEYDKKTQMELEISKKNNESKKKTSTDGKSKSKSLKKLSPEDRALFEYMKKVDPKITIEKFLEVNGSDQIPD